MTSHFTLKVEKNLLFFGSSFQVLNQIIFGRNTLNGSKKVLDQNPFHVGGKGISVSQWSL